MQLNEDNVEVEILPTIGQPLSIGNRKQRGANIADIGRDLSQLVRDTKIKVGKGITKKREYNRNLDWYFSSCKTILSHPRASSAQKEVAKEFLKYQGSEGHVPPSRSFTVIMGIVKNLSKKK